MYFYNIFGVYLYTKIIKNKKKSLNSRWGVLSTKKKQQESQFSEKKNIYKLKNFFKF